MLGSSCACRLRAVGSVVQQTRLVRRSVMPPPWLPQKYRAHGDMGLTPQNQELVSRVVAGSPLREEPVGEGAEWRPLAKRSGLIVRKIGVLPQWRSDGSRVMATLLQVLDNHVVSYQSPEEWWKSSVVGKRKAFNRRGSFGKLTVGAIPADPNAVTAVYAGLFGAAGCGVKQRLASFMVTEDAAVEAGTRLQAAHFQVGQFLTVSGRSVDWGFQGVVHRWGFRGSGGKSHGVTKNHRRPGATGTSGDGKVWPGKPLPGHMGWNWAHAQGLRLLRVNHKHQVLYVAGQSCPGETGEILLVKDSFIPGKRVDAPPFPTYFPSPDLPLAEDELWDGLHPMGHPTITYSDKDIVDMSAVLRRREVKKQAKAKR